MSPDPQEDKEEDYYANMGDAIRTLREDIPQLFRKVLTIVFIARISYSRILDWSLGALRITRLYFGP
eukprot:jgi/Picre1/34040/NNA_001517.t1